MYQWVCLFLMVASGCGDAAVDPTPDDTCDGLYGAPNENTGLTETQCMPRIEGTNGVWQPIVWDEETLESLRQWTLEPTPTVSSEDPYLSSEDWTPTAGQVCAVHKTIKKTYRLETHDGVEQAWAAKGIVTHGGACGLCSSLEDLAVYAATTDLTEPVRSCGLKGLTEGLDAVDACIQEQVGFTPPCARIWAYNTQNTRNECLDSCLSALNDPYHQEDGTLNACLQCDEDESGPVFKGVAGRTRRNSGLATALCRPCDTVWQLQHKY